MNGIIYLSGQAKDDGVIVVWVILFGAAMIVQEALAYKQGADA